MECMKAVLNTAAGASIATVDDPRPNQHEALVRVGAFSVNRGELALLKARTERWRPGQDIAGVVVEPAADGSGPPAGSRVVALVEEAGWSELVNVPTNRLAVLPAQVGIEQAAALPLVGLTALRTLRLGGALLGKRVLVTGAGGAVGGTQVQLAAAAGAVVTAVSSARHPSTRPSSTRPSSTRHGPDLLARGAASVVLDAAAAEGWYDLVADWAGGDSLAAAIGKVAPHGTVVLGSGSTDKTPINIYDFLGHEGARIVAYLSYAHPEPPAADLATLVRFVADGRLEPVVGLVANWSQLPDALTALTERRVIGKVVLTVD
jgi:NADPH:quinone reductase